MSTENDPNQQPTWKKVLSLLGALLALVLIVVAIEYFGDRTDRSAGGYAIGHWEDFEGAPPDDLRLGEYLEEKQRRLGPADPGADILPGEYIVRMRDDADAPELDGRRVRTGDDALDAALERLSPTDLRAPGARLKPRGDRPAGAERAFVFGSEVGEDEVLDSIGALDAVEWVEPLVQVRTTSATPSSASTPSDPYYIYQWGMIVHDVPSAWDMSTGAGVVVAVVDTGVSVSLDGLTEVLPGWDFVDDDSDASDEHWHGTHVAGIIGQRANNDEGVAGVAPGVSILPVRVLNANGSGNSANLAAGIVWAVDNGAQVINMSLAFGSYSEAVAEACDYATRSGVVLVAASGNDYYDNFVAFPASLENVIAVGASNLSDEVSPYSNKGVELDVVAPGGDLTQDIDANGVSDGIVAATIIDGSWLYYATEGTSMASPFVAGVAALLIESGVTDVDAVTDAILNTAMDMGEPGHDTVYGYGMIDPATALGYTPGSGSRGSRTTAVVEGTGGGCAAEE